MTEIETERLTLRPYTSGEAAGKPVMGPRFSASSACKSCAIVSSSKSAITSCPKPGGAAMQPKLPARFSITDFAALQLERIVAVVLPDNKPSARVIHRLALSYIEDPMHADLTHRFYALSREAYFSGKNNAT